MLESFVAFFLLLCLAYLSRSVDNPLKLKINANYLIKGMGPTLGLEPAYCLIFVSGCFDHLISSFVTLNCYRNCRFVSEFEFWNHCTCTLCVNCVPWYLDFDFWQNVFVPVYLARIPKEKLLQKKKSIPNWTPCRTNLNRFVWALCWIKVPITEGTAHLGGTLNDSFLNFSVSKNMIGLTGRTSMKWEPNPTSRGLNFKWGSSNLP